jgi:hypothetical protein
MIPKFMGKFSDGNNPVLFDAERTRMKIYLRKFKPGELIYVTVGKVKERKQRSLEQNAYYHGVVLDILSDEIGYDHDEMHDALRYKFLQYENVKGLKTILSTTQLTTKEFEVFLSRIRRWAAMDMGIFIPKPNEVEI